MAIPFLKLFIDEAFLDALHLRYEEIVRYMLESGYNVEEGESVVLSVCYSLEYLRHSPPTELLELLLQYGANPNQCDEKSSQTPFHISAQYGCV